MTSAPAVTTAASNHPVWAVYDQFRTVRLRLKYFSEYRYRLERQSFWMEILLALTTTGSAVSALGFQDSRIGSIVWQTLLVISAVVAAAKPLLRLTPQIQLLQEIITEYTVIEHEFEKLEIAIKTKGTYDKVLQNRFSATLRRMDELRKKDGTFRVDKKLLNRCFAEVKRELPDNRFFVPNRRPYMEGEQR